ncbi:inorganic phosphate transporter [Natronococcus occultus]|uniref:Uncharacterized protein n=1 Tax=Natronococcus occultus SP4 TaxID=694430 RepID=L0JYN6_9EURY|nr:hypothetical protein [Natronococcus occultus]AGB36973.1 hypothetical protein Natoc_1135 [Natronococcus occultus SP4]
MTSFRAAMGDELDPGAILGVTAVLAVFAVLADLSAGTVIAIPAGLVGIAALRAVCTARGYPDAIAGAVLGAVGVLVFASLAIGDGAVVFGVLAAVAAWLCLDSLYDLRLGIDRSSEPDEDISEAEYYLVSAHGWAVLRELREADRPLSRAELQDRTGLPNEDFERVLETVGDSGPIERVGTGYVLDESETGTTAMTRSVVRAVGGRLLRPLRLLGSLRR